MADFQEELLEPYIDDGSTPNGAIRREGPIDITRALPGRGGVVPPLKKAENKAERVMASKARPVIWGRQRSEGESYPEHGL